MVIAFQVIVQAIIGIQTLFGSVARLLGLCVQRLGFQNAIFPSLDKSLNSLRFFLGLREKPTLIFFTSLFCKMNAVTAKSNSLRQIIAKLGVSRVRSCTTSLSTRQGCRITLIVATPFFVEGLQIKSMSVSRKQCTSIQKDYRSLYT